MCCPHPKKKPLPTYILSHVSSCWLDIVKSATRIMATRNQEINLIAPGHHILSPWNRRRRLADMNLFLFHSFFSPLQPQLFRGLSVDQVLYFLGFFSWLMNELYCFIMLNKRSTTRKGEALWNRIMVPWVSFHSGIAIFDVSLVLFEFYNWLAKRLIINVLLLLWGKWTCNIRFVHLWCRKHWVECGSMVSVAQ